MEGSKGKEKKGFESLWADRFAEAETAPADHIWKSISGELANQQVGSYKKRAFYYKWAAAASLFLALALGVLYFSDISDQSNESQITGTLPPILENSHAKPSSTTVGKNDDQLTSLDDNTLVTSTDQITGKMITKEEKGSLDGTPLKGLADDDAKSSIPTVLRLKNPVLIADTPKTAVGLSDEQKTLEDNTFSISWQMAKPIQRLWLTEAATTPDRIYGVPIFGSAQRELEGNSNQSLWAGLNLGSGNFDANFGPPTGSLDEAIQSSQDAFAPALDAETAGLPLREESNSGPSIAVGIDVGKSIGNRWVLQSGLTYGRYRVNSNTNLVFSSANQKAVPLSFQNREALFSGEEVTVTSDNVEVDNNFQLLSIPAKVGFLLIDKKFNILLNAGLASDIYLGNSLNTSGEEFASYDITPGSDSPYKRVHLNGLTSVQLGYQIQNNYYLSLEPSYRKAISNFAKSGNSFSSRPSSLSLVVGFRYLFR